MVAKRLASAGRGHVQRSAPHRVRHVPTGASSTNGIRTFLGTAESGIPDLAAAVLSSLATPRAVFGFGFDANVDGFDVTATKVP